MARVPTPFYHIEIAQRILRDERLPEPIHTELDKQRGAFFFGNTAPDVQVVAGLPRADTHFFDVPPIHLRPPWARLLRKHRELDPKKISDAQRAFMAGYFCHLQADLLWITQLFIPYFGPYLHWETFKERLRMHNALRAYLDIDIRTELPAGLSENLGSVDPVGWLPFVDEPYLTVWRDRLARQLGPEGMIETIEVFAERDGVTPESLQALVEDETAMAERVFSHIASEKLIEYRDALVSANITLLTETLTD
jgi:hypothetical protein